MTHADLPPLRGAADLAQPPLPVLLAGLPAGPLLSLGSTNRHATLDGICFPLYYMAGHGELGRDGRRSSRPGARIAAERQVGWTRQLRITPLRTWSVLPRPRSSAAT